MYALFGFVCTFSISKDKKGFEKGPSPWQERSAPYPLLYAMVQNNYFEQQHRKV